MGQEEVRLQAEIEALLTKAGAVDAEEDEHWGEDFRGDELPQELQRREKRLAAIQAAKALWRQRNARAMMSTGANLGRTAIPGAGGLTSAPTASPSRRRRAISPTPRARS